VAVLRTLLLFVAVAGAAVMPCALALLIVNADEVFERIARAIRRGLRRVSRGIGRLVLDSSLGRRWRLGRLARALRLAPPVEPVEPQCPPIEQVAADLRRLSRQREGVATRSPVWFTAVQRAHDDRLRVACGQLGIEQHLGELSGIDLDLERARLEGELQAAGLAVRDRDRTPRSEQR
jgi:hypothetical protein